VKDLPAQLHRGVGILIALPNVKIPLLTNGARQFTCEDAAMPPTDNHRPEDITAQGLDLAASLIRELFVDLLGSLVPGFLFTMFAVPMVIWTGAVLLRQNLTGWKTLSDLFAVPGYVLFSLIIVISYVLGFVFSRRDPKVPDQKSLGHILRKDWANVSRAVVRPREQKHKLQMSELSTAPEGGPLARKLHSFKVGRFTRELARSEGGQFPYSHLREYLSGRGLDHLARHVPWSGDGKSIDKRSKLFINVLKIRLQYWNSRKCGEIVRNEAHVRMMSSVWYAAWLLQLVYGALIAALLIYNYYQDRWKIDDKAPWAIFVVLGVLLVAATAIRVAVVTFLHYQRVREIVYVLETAQASEWEGNKHIFEDFEPARQEK
jgi:hypothetical protein